MKRRPPYVEKDSPPSSYAVAAALEKRPDAWGKVSSGTLQRALFLAPGLALAGVRGEQLVKEEMGWESVRYQHRYRWEIINSLITRFGYKKYLEIGVAEGVCFYQVCAEHKISVDPGYSVATFKIGADQFFDMNREVFDIIFIDGLHVKEQVLRDFGNSLKFLSEGGSIVVHDCNPVNEESTDNLINGTVWEAWAHYRMHRPDLSMAVLDTDQGCGVIRRGRQALFPPTKKMDFGFLAQNRKRLLNLVPPVWPGWLDDNFR
ncbi:MAG: class I SAM-dependent methyltransferase [Anaerolineae bacterium]